MDEKKVRDISSSCMLDYDEAVFESLTIIKEMMEEVVQSELCRAGEKGGAVFAPVVEKEVLREDRTEVLYAREEMLSHACRRQGEFVVVPRVVGE